MASDSAMCFKEAVLLSNRLDGLIPRPGGLEENRFYKEDARFLLLPSSGLVWPVLNKTRVKNDEP